MTCAPTRTPDHDTICEFRRRNFAAVADCFLRVLLLAKELRLLKVGTISLDGTRLDASASKHRNVTYARGSPARRLPCYGICQASGRV